jgi:hypothetical protein
MAAIRGWVYIITNKAMPGLVKVGFSTKDPALRAADLNHSGAPHPFEVAFDILVEEPRDVEQKVHDALRGKREGKEWFRCSVEEAIYAIDSVEPCIPETRSSRYDEFHMLDLVDPWSDPEILLRHLWSILSLPDGRQKQEALRWFKEIPKQRETMDKILRERGMLRED